MKEVAASNILCISVALARVGFAAVAAVARSDGPPRRFRCGRRVGAMDVRSLGRRHANWSRMMVIDSENRCEMPRFSAALPSGAVTFFWRVQIGTKMTLAGVFLTSGRGRARLTVLSSYIPVIAVESAWNTWDGRTSQSKAQAIEKQPRNSPHSYLSSGRKTLASQASDKVSKSSLCTTT